MNAGNRGAFVEELVFFARASDFTALGAREFAFLGGGVAPGSFRLPLVEQFFRQYAETHVPGPVLVV